MNERRWKVIGFGSHQREHSVFRTGDILAISENDNSYCPEMTNGHISYFCCTDRLVEIDEEGNTIRTYKDGDTLDGGTLVQEEKKMTTLENVSMKKPMQCENIDGCEHCPLNGIHYNSTCTSLLAAEVQRLRDERENNPGVWDGSPEWATKARPRYQNQEKRYEEWGSVYTREIPKTLEQEIAEKYYGRIICADDESDAKDVIDEIIAELKERTK